MVTEIREKVTEIREKVREVREIRENRDGNGEKRREREER